MNAITTETCALDSVCCTEDNVVIVGGEHGFIAGWSLDGIHCFRTLVGYNSTISSMCYSKQNNNILYCAFGRSVVTVDRRIISNNSNSTDFVASYTYNKDDINNIALNADETLLASCDDDGYINILDLRIGKSTALIKAHSNISSKIEFRKQFSSGLISSGYDCNIKLWDISMSHCVQTIDCNAVVNDSVSDGHVTMCPQFIHDIVSNCDGTYLAAGLESGSICLFNISSKKMLFKKSSKRHAAGVASLVFPTSSPTMLVSAGNDDLLLTWDISVKLGSNSGGLPDNPVLNVTNKLTHIGKINAIASVPKDNKILLAVVDCDNRLCFYSRESLKCGV